MIITLDKNWTMSVNDTEEKLSCGGLPVSMYQTLLKNNRMDNPYYGENEYLARELSRSNCAFYKSFEADERLIAHDKVFLRFYGVDTLSEIYLNGVLLGTTDNMFRTYEYDVKSLLKAGENRLEVRISSPLEYVEKAYEKRKIYGVDTTVNGYPHLRKCHCMFGWDWGPQLPDMGVWRSVELIAANAGIMRNVYAVQRYSKDYSALTLTVSHETDAWGECDREISISLSDGRVFSAAVKEGENAVFEIANPPLWYPRGYGEQPLQKITARLVRNGETLSEISETIGFRTLTVNMKNGFCFSCNGTDLFAMGANVIPQDQIFPFITEERTEKFLSDCAKANYNTLRIWGGGYYPDDFFLRKCDEMGFILWEDFMFACSAYRLTPELESTVKAEIYDNVKRMRNHACIGLWCGNNEIESAWEGWGLPEDPESKADYVRLFEEIIPSILKETDPERFYWPSSPSSGGNQYGENGVFHKTWLNDTGNQHYWDIWHNFKPLEEFRKYRFSFCSEYGFEALPSIKTVRSFAEEKDLNLCSPVMENHQKCVAGNEKLLYYIAQLCRYPYDFERLIYASQLVQCDAIRSDVEHMRRNRGVCMGSLYWQVNDSNPVISWSSIDYFGRWKGLHYTARRFYAPVLLSCLEENHSAVTLNLCSESTEKVSGVVKYALRDRFANIIEQGEISAEIQPLSAKDIAVLDLEKHLDTREKQRSNYLEYSFAGSGRVLSKGTTIFVRPKAFTFENPHIKADFSETEKSFAITFTADCYAKSVCLELAEADCVFSDNWFDINGAEPVTVEINKADISEELTLEQLKEQLKIMSNFDLQ